MIIPFIAAAIRDVFETVPPVFKDPPTAWSSSPTLACPSAAASWLGLGQALGESRAK
ncbi:MAG: hypothetical protein ABSC06_37320 [Rhodopila sp.]|jgi:phosphate transport system permease protein